MPLPPIPLVARGNSSRYARVTRTIVFRVPSSESEIGGTLEDTSFPLVRHLVLFFSYNFLIKIVFFRLLSCLLLEEERVD